MTHVLNISEKCFYENGNFYDYYDNAILKAKGEYKDNEFHGVYLKYDKKGNIIKKINYKNGKILKHHQSQSL